ncbi:hypothetical protein [Nocardia arthritidis]|uniref:Uncharacterized protein n=1 Tax=Nocardia arthritidis TaxID=228602 RepID=A0A6G9YP06_9NOCA|nr:hypothetical protein [Nocardia arthritidis]QIS14928.1 hypothetical protein F5544_35485 [Nocardia arthritidis]
MTPETNSTGNPFGAPDPALHLEYLYGPQWREVVQIVERAAQLTAEERERLNAQFESVMNSQMAGLSQTSGAGGFAGLLSGLGRSLTDRSSTDPQPGQIATETAREFGRVRNLQTAGTVAGQAISPNAAGVGEIAGLLNSLGSIGVITVVGQAVTAAVLGDLVGRGRFTQDVYDAMMRPWRSVIS